MNAKITIRRATIDDLETVVRYNAALADETEDKPLDRAVLTSGVRRGNIQLGWTPRGRLGAQRRLAALPVNRLPASHAPPVDTKHAGDFN